MKKAKLFLTFFSAFMFTFMLLPTVAAADNDYSGHWAEKSIERAITNGWVRSEAGGENFRPNDPATRAEFIDMINRVMSFTKEADISAYKDVAPEDWYYGAFSAALAAGYLTGYEDQTMRPNVTMPRVQAFTIFARLSSLDTNMDPIHIATNVNDWHTVANWAQGSVAAAISAGYVNGTGNHNISGSATFTRAEAVVLLERFHDDVRMFAFPGSYSLASVGSVVIQSDAVTLSNARIKKDLTIAEAVGDGDVYLNNVQVEGKLNVQGGGANSIHINESNIAEIIITKDEVRVVLQDGSTVTYANISGNSSSIEIGSGVQVANLVVEAPNITISLTDGAGITNVTVAAGAEGTKIDTQEGTSIGTATINAKTEVTGGVSIETANIKAPDVVIESQPKSTNVDQGITANVNNKDVTSQPETPSSSKDSSSPTPTYYTVSFDLNGVTCTTSEPVAVTGTANSTFTLPAAMTASTASLTFLGWSTNPTDASATAADTTATISGHATYYAKWGLSATVGTDVTLPNSCTISSATQITGGTVTVPAGIILTNNSTLTVAGTLQVDAGGKVTTSLTDGQLWHGDTLQGGLIERSGGSGNNHNSGTGKIHNDGYIYNYVGVNFFPSTAVTNITNSASTNTGYTGKGTVVIPRDNTDGLSGSVGKPTGNESWFGDAKATLSYSEGKLTVSANGKLPIRTHTVDGTQTAQHWVTCQYNLQNIIGKRTDAKHGNTKNQEHSTLLELDYTNSVLAASMGTNSTDAARTEWKNPNSTVNAPDYDDYLKHDMIIYELRNGKQYFDVILIVYDFSPENFDNVLSGEYTATSKTRIMGTDYYINKGDTAKLSGALEIISNYHARATLTVNGTLELNSALSINATTSYKSKLTIGQTGEIKGPSVTRYIVLSAGASIEIESGCTTTVLKRNDGSDIPAGSTITNAGSSAAYFAWDNSNKWWKEYTNYNLNINTPAPASAPTSAPAEGE